MRRTVPGRRRGIISVGDIRLDMAKKWKVPCQEIRRIVDKPGFVPAEHTTPPTHLAHEHDWDW